MAEICVVGATSWGTTLAIITAREGRQVRLLTRSEDEATALRLANENTRFLPGAPFPPSMSVTARADEALAGVDIVIIAVPSMALRCNARRIRKFVGSDTVVASASKGLEADTGNRMSQVLQEEFAAIDQPPICALSGPNLAREIIQGKPSSTVVASPDGGAARTVQTILNSSVFRVYTNADIVGVELGGALKNIIAIGAGICDGLRLGDNTKAAFMTRGLAEIARLGLAAGAQQVTLSGLAGMGDLIATCSSTLSRNHYVGTLLSQGKTLDEIRSGMHNVAEGVNTTVAARNLAANLGVEMPLTDATYRILFQGMSVHHAAAELMGRTPIPE